MKKYYYFIISLILLILSFCLLESTKKLSDKEYYNIMLEASQKTQNAFEAIKKEKLSRGFNISTLDDPNMTGLIGEAYTEITTTLGNLEAKRSTTNPNIAAMIVDMLKQCNIKKGDTIAVNLSSSFPCVNIAVICALDSMELNGIIINSVGASSYGANISEFTYLDMEYFLYKNQYINNHTTFFSMGGTNDTGKEMPKELKNQIIARLKSYNLKFLDYNNIDENIIERYKLYKNQADISAFINAGGNLVAFGGGSEMVSAKNGILLSDSDIKGNKGLIPIFLSENIPVIHLLNMKSLLSLYGFPIDPIPVPMVGEGNIYKHYKYNMPLSITLFVLNIFYLLYAVKKFPHKKYQYFNL